MVIEVHAARGDFVQQRLPQVRACAIDKRHASAAPTAERIAEPRREFEAAGATADDDDAMRKWHESKSRVEQVRLQVYVYLYRIMTEIYQNSRFGTRPPGFQTRGKFFTEYLNAHIYSALTLA
jgi:hypothetical protein